MKLNIILFGVIAYALTVGHIGLFPDFHVYFDAARGIYWNYEEADFLKAWLYPDELRYLWAWTLPLTWDEAWPVWFLALCASWIYLGRKVAHGVRYGWLLLVVCAWPLAWMLGGGNIEVLLLALSLSPLGAALACAVKPQYLLIVLLHYWRRNGADEPDREASHVHA